MSKPEKMQSVGIDSINRLSRILTVPLAELKELAGCAEDHYHPYGERKPDGRIRTIHNPDDRLKAIQKKIKQYILGKVEYESHLHGGIKNRSARTNVERHVAKGLVIALDLKNFFPTITEQHIYKVWRHRLQFGRSCAKLLTGLTSYDNQLPQGAPTSTAIANLVLFRAENDLKEALKKQNIDFSACTTRFVDDFTISGCSDKQIIISTFIGVLGRYGFRFHRKREKLKIMPASGPQEITGLIANVHPAIAKEKRNKIRSAVFQLEKAPIHEQEKQYASVQGRVIWLRQCHPRQGNELMRRLILIKKSINN